MKIHKNLIKTLSFRDLKQEECFLSFNEGSWSCFTQPLFFFFSQDGWSKSHLQENEYGIFDLFMSFNWNHTSKKHFFFTKIIKYLYLICLEELTNILFLVSLSCLDKFELIDATILFNSFTDI